METDELILENCWSVPDLHITFLGKGYVFAEFKNNSRDTIEIKQIKLRFQTDKGLEPSEFSNEGIEKIEPRNLCKVQIPFEVDLSVSRYTNSYSLLVTYRKGSSHSNTITFRPFSKSLIVHSVRPPEKIFFISHKDPEDTELCRQIDNYLKKIGFNGFLAEDHKQPGLDIWTQKIFPAIESCVALIVVWTSNSITKPETILKEVDYAISKKKPFLVIADHDVQLDDKFKGNIEYYRCKSNISQTDLITFVTAIHKTYVKGGYP
jgi:hypothetical protein